MKTILKFSLLAVAALAMSSCAPATNTNSNTTVNTNANMAAKPAAPTADSLMALEQKAWEAYKNKDGKYFEGFLSDRMIAGNGEGEMAKADVVKMITNEKDEVKSFTLSDPHITTAGADVAVLTYKATVDGTENGKALPSPVTAATVFVRTGSDWKASYHNEVPDVEAKKKNAAATPAAAEKKDASAAGEEKKDVKKDAAANTGKKEAPAAPPSGNSNSNMAANTKPAPAPSVDAALTDALMAAEKKGWESWKAKDAKALDESSSKDIAFIDAMGKATFGKDAVMKMWTTDNPCTVSSVSLSDGKATSLSKDAAILVAKGTAVGTCGEAKLEPLWNTTVFVKEGEVWKAAYIFEMPVRKM